MKLSFTKLKTLIEDFIKASLNTAKVITLDNEQVMIIHFKCC